MVFSFFGVSLTLLVRVIRGIVIVNQQERLLLSSLEELRVVVSRCLGQFEYRRILDIIIQIRFVTDGISRSSPLTASY
jgi:hypothetical protein